jgi:hypothetical protein
LKARTLFPSRQTDEVSSDAELKLQTEPDVENPESAASSSAPIRPCEREGDNDITASVSMQAAERDPANFTGADGQSFQATF